jgi:hypothetical protein
MDTTQISQASSNSGFNTAFFVVLGAGFILGILASYIANFLWERHKKKKWGDQPYLNTSVSQGKIYFEGQMPTTSSNTNALFETFKRIH